MVNSALPATVTVSVPLTVMMAVVLPPEVEIEVENCPVMTKPVPPMLNESVPLAMTEAECAVIVRGFPEVSFKAIPPMLVTSLPVELKANSAVT